MGVVGTKMRYVWMGRKHYCFEKGHAGMEWRYETSNAHRLYAKWYTSLEVWYRFVVRVWKCQGSSQMGVGMSKGHKERRESYEQIQGAKAHRSCAQQNTTHSELYHVSFS